MSAYRTVYERSLREPERFWAEAAESLTWHRRWDTTLDDSRAPFYRWFAGGSLNTCYNALDRHVDDGRAEQAALVYDSPMTGTVDSFTYARLRDEVARFAGALRDLGVSRGDRVLIYMPMVPETVIGMLACARLGAVHSVVFGGFAAPELASRIDDARPKVVLSASCGLEPNRVVEYKPILDAAIESSASPPERTVILQRPQSQAELVPGRDVDWGEAAAAASPAECVPVDATDPLYILYTSGTTGQPKGIVRDNGGHAVALAWSMKAVYGVDPGEVFWAASDVGWVVGHSYIRLWPAHSRLYHRVIFEGKPVGTPDAGVFWRVISRARGQRRCSRRRPPSAPFKREDPERQSCIRSPTTCRACATFFLAGERCDPDTLVPGPRTISRSR